MQEHHSIPARTYYIVFAALMVLMVMTVGARFVDFGSVINVMIAMGIAIAKTVLIVLYFMHVRYNTPLTKVFAATGFVFLLILFVLTMADYLSRNWPPPVVGPFIR